MVFRSFLSRSSKAHHFCLVGGLPDISNVELFSTSKILLHKLLQNSSRDWTDLTAA